MGRTLEEEKKVEAPYALNTYSIEKLNYFFSPLKNLFLLWAAIKTTQLINLDKSA